MYISIKAKDFFWQATSIFFQFFIKFSLNTISVASFYTSE